MFKKSMNLVLMVAIVFGAISTVNAQEDDKSYNMYESVMLTPDNTKLKALGEAMRNHNEKYHKEGIHKANVFMINSGPNSGKIIWDMGPTMFKHLDTRPAEGGHDEDWRDNVMSNIKRINTIEYWRQNDKLSNVDMLDGDASKYPILFVRYSEISDDAHSLNDLFEKVSKTIKAMEGENPWGLYYNMFRQGDLGRHVATVSFYKNWTDFDENRKFKEAFLKVNGENSWGNFQDTLDATFSNSWDEIWVYNKYMSGQ